MSGHEGADDRDQHYDRGQAEPDGTAPSPGGRQQDGEPGVPRGTGGPGLRGRDLRGGDGHGYLAILRRGVATSAITSVTMLMTT